MPNPSQLLLLADHIKLSLLERQRAISLGLEPNSQDKEISRSFESLREGIESTESEYARLEENDDHDTADLKDQLDGVRLQYRDLLSQFQGVDADAFSSGDNDPALIQTKRSASLSTPDIKHPVPQHPSSKSVRFMEASSGATTVNVDDDDPNRDALFQPYRDSPSPPSRSNDQSAMSNQQIHDEHSQILRDQDDQLDRLGESIGRQHQLSIQIGDELEGHVALLDGMEADVDRHQSRLDVAKRRLNKIRKGAGDNWSMMTIIGLIIVLVILIVILK